MPEASKNPLPDWALDMAKLNYNPMADRAAFNFATGGPTSMAPADPPQVSQARPAANSSGWQAERPLQPQRDIALIDAMCVNADARERQQAQAPDVLTQMATACTAMMQQQSTMIAILAQHLINEKDAEAGATATPRKKS